MQIDIEVVRREWGGNKRKPKAPQAAFDILDELADARSTIVALMRAQCDLTRRVADALEITHEAMRDHPEELINPCPCRWHRLQNALKESW